MYCRDEQVNLLFVIEGLVIVLFQICSYLKGLMHKVDNCILWANLKWAMIGYMLAYDMQYYTMNLQMVPKDDL